MISISKKIEFSADVAGFIPIVSTFTGLTRVIYGIGKAIFNTIKICFEQNEQYKSKYSNRVDQGFNHIKWGCLEMIPFAKLGLAIGISAWVLSLLAKR